MLPAGKSGAASVKSCKQFPGTNGGRIGIPTGQGCVAPAPLLQIGLQHLTPNAQLPVQVPGQLGIHRGMTPSQDRMRQDPPTIL